MDKGLAETLAIDSQAVVEVGAALGAAQHAGGFLHFQGVQSPSALQHHGSAVLELDKSESRILNGELFRIPGAPGIGGVLGIGQLAVGGADNHLRLIVIHEPEREIQRMGADIDERTAALLILVEEYAPGGHGAAADGQRAGIVDFTQITVVNGGLQVGGIGTVAALIPNG